MPRVNAALATYGLVSHPGGQTGSFTSANEIKYQQIYPSHAHAVK